MSANADAPEPAVEANDMTVAKPTGYGHEAHDQREPGKQKKVSGTKIVKKTAKRSAFSEQLVASYTLPQSHSPFIGAIIRNMGRKKYLEFLPLYIIDPSLVCNTCLSPLLKPYTDLFHGQEEGLTMVNLFAKFKDTNEHWYQPMPGTKKVVAVSEFNDDIPQYSVFRDFIQNIVDLDQAQHLERLYRLGQVFKYPEEITYEFVAKLKLEKDGFHHNGIKAFLEQIHSKGLEAGHLMRCAVKRISDTGVDRYKKTKGSKEITIMKKFLRKDPTKTDAKKNAPGNVGITT